MAAVSDAGLVAALSDLAQSDISDHWIHHRRPKEDDSVRPAAVLMLFGRGTQPRTEAGLREQDRLGDFGDVDVVLLKRADTLRNLGYELIRFSPHDVESNPASFLSTVHSALNRARR